MVIRYLRGIFMYCYKCGAKNNDNVNFCYKCGTKIAVKSSKKIISKKVKKDIDFYNFYLYNKIITSKNKYVSIYFYILSFVFSSSFFTIICKSFSKKFTYTISLIYDSPYNMVPTVYRGYVEQACRDLWCRLFLLFIFFLIMILDVFIFFKLIKWYKNKKYSS